MPFREGYRYIIGCLGFLFPGIFAGGAVLYIWAPWVGVYYMCGAGIVYI